MPNKANTRSGAQNPANFKIQDWANGMESPLNESNSSKSGTSYKRIHKFCMTATYYAELVKMVDSEPIIRNVLQTFKGRIIAMPENDLTYIEKPL